MYAPSMEFIVCLAERRQQHMQLTLGFWTPTLQVGLIGTEAALLGPAEDDAVEAARENFALQRAELEGALMTTF